MSLREENRRTERYFTQYPNQSVKEDLMPKKGDIVDVFTGSSSSVNTRNEERKACVGHAQCLWSISD